MATHDSDAAYIAAHTRLPNGELAIDEILARAAFIREARRARWPEKWTAHLVDSLVAGLDAYYHARRRLDDA